MRGENWIFNTSGKEELHAKKGQFPWMVKVYTRLPDPSSITYKICGGALISGRHVLTAAHCFFEKFNNRSCEPTEILDMNMTTVGLGIKADEWPLNMKIVGRKTLFHVNKPKCYIDHDIAILELDRNVDEADGIPICLPLTPSNVVSKEKDALTIAGWGWSKRF